MRFKEIMEGLRDPKDNPCWKGYKPVGTKKKNGKTVPNCVPKESVKEGRAGIDDTDTVGFYLETERAYEAVMGRYGDMIDHDETSGIMYAPVRIWPKIEMVAFDADGIGAKRDDDLENPEHYGVAEGNDLNTYIIIYKNEQNQTKQKKVQSSSATRAQAKFEKAYPNYRVVGLKDWEQGVAEGVTSPEIKQAYDAAMKTEPNTPERKRAVAHYQKLRADAMAKKKQSGVAETSRRGFLKGVAGAAGLAATNADAVSGAWNTPSHDAYNRQQAEKAHAAELKRRAEKKAKHDAEDKSRKEAGLPGPTLWQKVKRHWGYNESVSEGDEQGTFAALKGWQQWNVLIRNNFYNGRYPDYSARLYGVVASSPEEARQVVLDNADYVLKDLLSKKTPNGKRWLPPKSAVPIEDKRVGSLDMIKPGSLTTMGFKPILTPDGLKNIKFNNGQVVDIQGQEQSVAEDSDKHTLKKELDKITGEMKLLLAHMKRNPNHQVHDQYKELLNRKDDIIAKLKQGVAEGSTGWMLKQDPALAKKVKANTQGYKDLKKFAGKPVPKKDEKGVAEGSNMNVVKSIKVGNFRHDLVDTEMGWQVRIYNGDKLYDTGLSKNSEQKGLAALEDAVAYTEKQTRTKRQGVAETAEQFYAIVNKVNNKVLSTHRDLESAKDEWRGLDKDQRPFYRVATTKKKPQEWKKD